MEKGGKRERVSNINVRETFIDCLLHAPQLGPRNEPATQARPLDPELNLQPFSARADALATEQHYPGPQLDSYIFYSVC